MNMEAQIGEIVPGAKADLLVYDGNPLENLEVLQDPDRNLKLIMKDGVIYKNTLG
jgi:imidazolonepropionase-like amidohydrolase